jgi:protein phosphatase
MTYVVVSETFACAAESVRNPVSIERTECRLDCVAVVHGILDEGRGDAPARAIIDVLASCMTADLWAPHKHTYGEELEQLIDEMEERLRRVAADPNLKALGCSGIPSATLDMLLFQPGRVRIVHVGDGRVYRWRRGTLEQLTSDHTLRPDVRLRVLGIPSPAGRVDVRDEPFERDDRIIACTPGVWQDIGDEGIASCLGGWPADGRGIEDGCNALRARVLAGSSKREASFVLTVAR